MSDTPPKTIFLALPTMGQYNFGLLDKISWFGMQEQYRVCVGRTVGELFHDSARNKLCQQFLESGCEYMLMIDADVDPSPNILDLTKHDKDIVGANVNAWMAGRKDGKLLENELFSSIWDRAPCEECRAVVEFQNTGKNKDPREYRIRPQAPDILERYDPFSHTWKLFYDRGARDFMSGKCRCAGSGRDPFVYNPSQKVLEPECPIQVDAVGAAAMLIKRRVIESMPPPWFQFVYRHMRDVMVTEDLWFCTRAKSFGFEVWADQNMPARHFKEVDLLQMNLWGGRLVERVKKQLMETQQKPRIIIPEMAGHFR